MSFDLLVTPGAQRVIQSMGLALRNRFMPELQRLANQPLAMSVPTMYPEWPECFEMVADIEIDQELHTFLVLWRFGAKGTALELLVIAHRECGPI